MFGVEEKDLRAGQTRNGESIASKVILSLCKPPSSCDIEGNVEDSGRSFFSAPREHGPPANFFCLSASSPHYRPKIRSLDCSHGIER